MRKNFMCGRAAAISSSIEFMRTQPCVGVETDARHSGRSGEALMHWYSANRDIRYLHGWLVQMHHHRYSWVLRVHLHIV